MVIYLFWATKVSMLLRLSPHFAYIFHAFRCYSLKYQEEKLPPLHAHAYRLLIVDTVHIIKVHFGLQLVSARFYTGTLQCVKYEEQNMDGIKSKQEIVMENILSNHMEKYFGNRAVQNFWQSY